MADQTTIPPPPDVEQAVPSVPHTTAEKVLGGIGSRATAFAQGLSGLSGSSMHPFEESSVGKSLGQHYSDRLAQARRHYENAQTYGNILGAGEIDPQTNEPTGIDPQTGKPLTPEQRAQYKQMAEGAWADFSKISGTTKEAKQQLQQKKGLFDLLVSKGHKAVAGLIDAHQKATGQGAGAQGASGGAQQPTSLSPPPAPGATSGGPTGAPVGGSTEIPPPPVYNPMSAAQAPMLRQGMADQRAIRMEKAKQDIITAGKIEEDKAKASSKKHLQHVPVTNPATGMTEPGSYDPESGEYLDQQGNVIPNAQLAAKQITYMGPGDKPLMGWAIGDTLYDQEMKPLPPGTEKFVAWMAPRTTTTEGFKTKTNPDGSTELVPVETTSTTTRGGTTGSTDSPKSQDMGEKSTSPIVGTGKPSAAKIKGAGIPFGGKVPPGVAKAYEAYNGSQERMAVMEDALPRALKGDQQAMLNLLANHVGMTMGLQKGGRITEGIYNEAAKSSPVAALFKARFDKDGNLSLNPSDYRGGVVLTPDQMRQMIDLAKVRMTQDRESWEREAAAAKKGYGMTSPPSPSTDIPDGTKGTWKGKDVVRKGGKWVLAPAR